VLAVLRSNKPLRRLLGAWAQSCLGTYAGYVALLFLTVKHLHTAWAVTAVLLAEFLPAIALGSWFGVLADRYPRRALIVTANLVQAAAWGGLVFSRTAAPILALALLAGVGNAMQRPALRSSLPLVAGPDSQLAAALYDAARWAGITLGPAIAAGLLALLSGVMLPLALNAASFLIAAAVMGAVPIPSAPPAKPGPSTARTGVRAGLAEAFAQPGVGALIACSAGAVIAGGLLNVSEPLLATQVLHGSGSDYALLVASYGVGMVLASALVLRAGAVPARTLIYRYLAGQALTALGMAGSAIVGSVALAAITFAGTGYANSLLLVSETQLIQARVPSSVQGRLFGVKDSVEGICFLVGLAGAGALVAASSVRVTLTTGAVICGVCAVAALLALRRRGSESASTQSWPRRAM
jgi:MFS family permease